MWKILKKCYSCHPELGIIVCLIPGRYESCHHDGHFPSGRFDRLDHPDPSAGRLCSRWSLVHLETQPRNPKDRIFQVSLLMAESRLRGRFGLTSETEDPDNLIKHGGSSPNSLQPTVTAPRPNPRTVSSSHLPAPSIKKTRTLLNLTYLNLT